MSETEDAMLVAPGRQPAVITVPKCVREIEIAKSENDAPDWARGRRFARAKWHDPIFLLPVFVET